MFFSLNFTKNLAFRSNYMLWMVLIVIKQLSDSRLGFPIQICFALYWLLPYPGSLKQNKV